jgi:uncharacterized membrane protein YfcA
MVVALGMMVGGVAAGAFGSLLGLGGGILIVPLLTLGFDLPLREAVGVSLVAVIMTSGASAAVYLERHIANMRLGMTLELFTAFGALVGGLVAFLLDERVLATLFTVLLVYTAITMARGRGAPDPETTDDPVPAHDPPTFTDSLAGPGYRIRNLPGATMASVFAGVISALLGVGGGLIKVPIMHLGMGVPLRVATATSNFMIGVTASAGAIVYLFHGGIDPYVAGPTAVGVFVGATAGSRLGHRVETRILRMLFVAVLLYTAFLMGRRALGL